jgi:hypothetical protein
MNICPTICLEVYRISSEQGHDPTEKCVGLPLNTYEHLSQWVTDAALHMTTVFNSNAAGVALAHAVERKIGE